jgi:hypothetical protein
MGTLLNYLCECSVLLIVGTVFLLSVFSANGALDKWKNRYMTNNGKPKIKRIRPLKSRTVRITS